LKKIGKTVSASTIPLRRAFGSRFFLRYLFVGLIAHFLLNKYVNFKAFDRTILAQARTYLVLQIPMLLITTAVITTCTSVFHLLPLLAKGVSIAINLPIGYLSHRYLTFNVGMRAFVRRVFIRSAE
jgi:putative flippase GtrA